MKTNGVENSQAYWTRAVEDFMKLGMKEALVPLTSLTSDTAMSISVQLGIRLEVRGADYVFSKP